MNQGPSQPVMWQGQDSSGQQSTGAGGAPGPLGGSFPQVQQQVQQQQVQQQQQGFVYQGRPLYNGMYINPGFTPQFNAVHPAVHPVQLPNAVTQQPTAVSTGFQQAKFPQPSLSHHHHHHHHQASVLETSAFEPVVYTQPRVVHPQPPAREVGAFGGTLPTLAVKSANALTLTPNEERPSSSHSANTSAGGLGGSEGSPQGGGPQGSGGTPGSSHGGNKSRYRGVSYDRKKAKWRVQIKVAALGKSGVSVGYYDTEEAAARAYDRAAIGLLGRDNPNLQTNYDLTDYAEEPIPRLTGKSREEVKTTLKSERIKQAPRRRFTSRQRTSRFMGVGSSNRKNQWQARILVHGKVTHLGYYETEEDAARVYDKVSLALHGESAQTNFPVTDYSEHEIAPYRGLDREDLQRALGVKPMDKSSRFRGVSKKKGKWEAKVMVNRRWAYRELFDSEEEAARAYDRALWRLKPREARSYVNFKDEIPEAGSGHLKPGAFGPYEPRNFAAGGFNRPGSDSELESEADDLDDDEYNDNDDGEGYGYRYGYGYGYGYGDKGGGDFEYEYKPTKGTRRSCSMRSKRAGSMPNLRTGTSTNPNPPLENEGGAAMPSSSAAHPSMPSEPSSRPPHFAIMANNEPTFLPMQGGQGLQLHFGGTATGAATGTELGFGFDDPNGEDDLLIGGADGEEFDHHQFFHQQQVGVQQVLGKRNNGMQRIHSEPQFLFGQDSIGNDKDFFQQDYFGGSEPPAPILEMVHQAPSDLEHMRNDDLGQLDVNLGLDFMNTGAGGGGGGGGGGASSLFEDEELALASLEFTRPKKMSKSVSTGHLGTLVQSSTYYNSSSTTTNERHGDKNGTMTATPTATAERRNNSGERQPSAHQETNEKLIGPLGHPIRRINTFSTNLPSFQEDEKERTELYSSPLRSTMKLYNSSEDDLVKQLLDSVANAEVLVRDA